MNGWHKGSDDGETLDKSGLVPRSCSNGTDFDDTARKLYQQDVFISRFI